MKKHIYLFRHGETYFNEKHWFTGWLDSKLTPKGVRSAEKIARKLRNKRIDIGFQTRLSRSKHTLRIVLKYHPECKAIITNDKMIERSYGKLEGKSHKSFVKKQGADAYKTLLHWHKVDHLRGWERKKFIEQLGEAELRIIRRSYTVAPPGGESIRLVEKRVLSFIKELLRFMQREKVNVAISAHGNSMRPFRRYFEGLTVEEMMELENPWDDYFDYVVEV